MRQYFYVNSFRNTKIKIAILLFSSLIFSQCKEEPQVWQKNSQELLAGDYIASNPDEFSEFEKLMKVTGMEALLNVRGPFTVFVPKNKAMLAYYEQKKVKSLDEFSDEFKQELIRTHVIGFEIPADEIGLGSLSQPNANGDYLSSEFEGSDIIISKDSRIIKRNIRTANGLIHLIDKVLDPVKEDIYTVTASNPSFKIFTKGLEMTGIKDTLQLISFPYGKTIARTRFTILAVADTIYNRYGIYDIDDLIEWCGGDPGNVTNISDPFYRYMEYHCLNGSYYLSDLNTGLYPILSRDNNLMFTIDSDYKINYNSKTKTYTGFIIPASNTPAKNGAVHAINDILPVTQPEPAVVIFQTTEFFDLMQGDYYGKYYWRFFDGQNTFSKIKWEGDYMLYYYKGIQNETTNHDCLSMNGWWSVSVTFPKLMKGKYSVSIFQPGWGDVTNCVVYIDGQLCPVIYSGPYGKTGGSGGLQKVAEVNFETTAEHTITLKNIVTGMLFWDYVRFDPIK